MSSRKGLNAMNPFLLQPDERLAAWIAFRRSLEVLPDEDRLLPVTAWWAQAPLMSIAYDPENPKSWPSPWEMIHTGDWCRNSVAIGMEATLRLSGVSAQKLRIAMLHVRDAQHMGLVVLYEDDLVLNFDWGRVVRMPADRHAIRSWRWEKRGYAEVGTGQRATAPMLI